MPDIDFQRIELNLIPKKGDEPVIFYASQYETTRPFIADLMWGETEFAPGDDCWAEIDIRKNDDNLVVITEDVAIDNNEVSVILPVQAVTCIGKNLGQVKIYAGEDQLIAALNFILEVQADPLAGGVTSETAIDNLTQQIEDIAQEVIGEDYYDKTEVDALLADKADVSDLPDMTDYYTKTATDALLADKADVSDLPDMTDYYTKTATDALLADKANVSDLPDMDDYYTAVQVDNLLYDMLPVGFTTGNPCIFDTEIAGPVKGLTAQIVCGGGNGTPSDPVPLVPHSEINLDVNGDTFTISFGQTVYGGVYDKSGRLTITWGYKDLGTCSWYLRNATATRQAWNTQDFIGIIKSPASLSTPYNALCDSFVGVDYNGTWLPGTFANSSTSDDTIAFCSNPNEFADADAFKASVNGVIFAYELATPIVINVPPFSAFAVNGTNTITSDCIGDVTTTYKDSIQHYIDTRL